MWRTNLSKRSLHYAFHFRCNWIDWVRNRKLYLTFMWPCIVINFLINKPTRCTNFSNLFLEWNSTCFGQFLCPSSGVFHCTNSNVIYHTGLLTACEQDQDRTPFHSDPGWNGIPFWSCSQAVSKLIWHIPLLCVQWKTLYDGHRNCPKYVEFHSKNKLEKLVHLVGFIIKKRLNIQ